VTQVREKRLESGLFFGNLRGGKKKELQENVTGQWQSEHRRGTGPVRPFCAGKELGMLARRTRGKYFTSSIYANIGRWQISGKGGQHRELPETQYYTENRGGKVVERKNQRMKDQGKEACRHKSAEKKA